MNLKLNVSEEAWSRWKAVIRHLSEPHYDFPASNHAEFSLLLRMFTGTGTTFRISRDRWKFVIDVLRSGNNIIDIVAITIIAHTIQDERHNGFVITKACRIHPNKDTKSPGSPELKWYTVTSGGEAFHHCCDKECIGPDRVNKRKLNWDSTRLNIIQKAFEQEVLELQRKNIALAKDLNKLQRRNEKMVPYSEYEALRAKTPSESSQLNHVRNQLTWSEQDVARYRENNRVMAEEIVRLREHDHLMTKEIESLRKQLETSEQQRNLMRYNNAQKEFDSCETRKQLEEKKIRVAHLEKELEGLRSKITNQQHAVAEPPMQWSHSIEPQYGPADWGDNGAINAKLSSENRELESKISQLPPKSHKKLIDANNHLNSKTQKLQSDNNKLQSENKKLRSENVQLKTMSAAMKQVNEDLKARQACLEDSKNQLEDQLEFAEQHLERLMESEQQLEVEQADLESALWVADDHNRLLESEVYFSRINEQESFNKQTEHMTALEDKIKLKDVLIEQLQANIIRYQTQPPSQPSTSSPNSQQPLCREELKRQRHISREAHERASDLESKLDAMKAAMTDKTDEMASLEKEWSAKVAEADGMKRRYHDKDAYITNLETKLEELRGTMENVLGQVSMHQGRKRRRTEGPDFQL
ncbi:hypothetical protein CCHR01_04567 [Colletotrichum chrysophilum]|uniref:Uncharacterized protein n=1 Tax=Colletotrichum chrysophilum TaxID=1836956 RepID=A0AAD9EQE3_9PEZI|nr:hypothetical protein CCHR01_04567 [Colletotrichum chrysophilum]